LVSPTDWENVPDEFKVELAALDRSLLNSGMTIVPKHQSFLFVDISTRSDRPLPISWIKSDRKDDELPESGIWQKQWLNRSCSSRIAGILQELGEAIRLQESESCTASN
jgi:hypothetical protein